MPGDTTRREALELLAGTVIAMAMIPENPVVGGTVLRRAAIQSPNFVTAVSGWSINQDGSAEFNNVTIRNGQIISGKAFYYSGTPAAGNLIASIAATAGTDSFGNNYLAGFAVYSSNAATQITASAGAALVTTYTGSLAAGWSAQGQVSGSAANLVLAAGSGGLVQINNSPAQITDANTAAIPLLEVTNTASSNTPLIRLTINALGDLFLGGRVSGDTNSRIAIDVAATSGNPRIRFGPGNAGPDSFIARTAANTLAVNGADLDINSAGRGLQIAEGANARMGTATLAAGTVVVSNTTITANTRIFLTCQTPGGTPGFLRVSARTAGASFTILSSSATDTSVVGWLLLEPG